MVAPQSWQEGRWVLQEEGGLAKNGDNIGVGLDGSNTPVGIHQTPRWKMVGINVEVVARCGDGVIREDGM